MANQVFPIINGDFSVKDLHTTLELGCTSLFPASMMEFLGAAKVELLRLRGNLIKGLTLDHLKRRDLSLEIHIFFVRRRKTSLINYLFTQSTLGSYGFFCSPSLESSGCFPTQPEMLLDWHSYFVGKKQKKGLRGYFLMLILDYLEGNKH